MKFVLLLLSLLIIFGLSHLFDSSDIPEIDEESITKDLVPNNKIELPQFSYKDLRGQERQIENFKGKKIILNFWATWCGPCKEEFPVMANIVAKSDDIYLVAISNDENRKDVDKYLKKMKKDFPSLKNAKVIFSHDKYKEISSELFNVLRLPETFIIDTEFNIVKKVIGSSQWLDGSMEKYLNTL